MWRHFAMGLTHFYKTAVILYLLLNNGKVLVQNVMKVLLHLYSDDALTEVK